MEEAKIRGYSTTSTPTLLSPTFISTLLGLLFLGAELGEFKATSKIIYAKGKWSFWGDNF
ncbi:hypothetical protein [Pontibacter vulgaris]|uniref:hypothetical protein n=1 Tax=Pontibacter vulgaris TaxID=2905679 RepID=UPI001FA80F5D|nr:hypothetical protein [Pontibacter vulgaris]